MASNLNFRPETFGQYGGLHNPGPGEAEVRDHRDRGGVVVRDHRDRGGVVVRDHRGFGHDHFGHPGGGFHGHPVGRWQGSPYRHGHGLSFSPEHWRGHGGFGW